jgi:hypothetical protein
VTRLRRYAAEVARTWRAHTRTPKHRAPEPRRTADPWTEQILDHIWTGYIHDWAERTRARGWA